MKSYFRIALAVVVFCVAGAGAYVWFYGVPESLPFGLGGESQAEERKKPPTPVTLAQAGQEDVTLTVEAVGDVLAVNTVTLSSRVTGRVEEVAFTAGQSVQEGQLLVRLDPADAETAVAAAQAQAEQAQQALRRAQQLARTGAGPRATANDLQRQAEAAQSAVQSAQERLDDYNIRAPFAGRLGLRNISVGSLAQPGTTIVTVDSIDPIKIRFALPERFLGQVRERAPVEAITPAFPGEPFKGEVSVISNRVDPALRTVQVEASIPNKDGKLLPGMLMEVTVSLGTRENAVVVPPLAVKLQGNTHFVFTVEEGKAKRIDVEVGQREPDRIEITRGLGKDIKVIVEGPQDLSSGQPVEEARAENEQEGEAQAAATPSQPAG